METTFNGETNEMFKQRMIAEGKGWSSPGCSDFVPPDLTVSQPVAYFCLKLYLVVLALVVLYKIYQGCKWWHQTGEFAWAKDDFEAALTIGFWGIMGPVGLIVLAVWFSQYQAPSKNK